MEYSPAFDTLLEEEIIGSMLYDPECIGDVIDLVKPFHFYHRQYQLLCEKIYELWQEDQTLVNLVQMAPFFAEIGVGIDKITQITGSIPTTAAAAIRHHGNRLRSLWSLREAMKVGYELTQLGHLRDREAIKELVEKAEAKLAKISDSSNTAESMSTMKSALMEFNKKFEEVYLKGEGLVGLSSGFPSLDIKTTGFKNSELIVIGGRSSMGKTAFALSLARNMSLDQNKTGIFFSLEMSKSSLAGRMIAAQAAINLQKLNSGLITPEEYERYALACGELSNSKLIIDEQPGLSVAEMKSRARKVKRERGELSFIIIDYLQYVRGSGRSERYLEVGEITRQLKSMAKEFDIPVIVLAQLSRKLELRQDKRPMMSDLRESGDIEQDADLIMFLYRDEYYNPDSEEKNITEVIIGKQRNGPTGSTKLLFLKESNLYFDLERAKEMANKNRS